MAILKKEVIGMDRTFALWLAAGILTFTVAFAGCQEKEEPAPAATPAPAAGAPAGAGAVAPAPAGGEASPGTPAASAETKTAEKREEGTKKY